MDLAFITWKRFGTNDFLEPIDLGRANKGSPSSPWVIYRDVMYAVFAEAKNGERCGSDPTPRDRETGRVERDLLDFYKLPMGSTNLL